MIKIYLSPTSTYSQKVLITAYEKGIEFEPVHTNLHDPDVRAHYRKEVNPLGKIPFLVRQDGWVIPESSIIMEYLDTYFPTDPVLIPHDRDLARQTRFYDRMGDLYLIAPGGVLAAELRKPVAERNQATIEKATADAQLSLSLFNAELKGREFLSAAHFTMADIAPGVGVARLARLGFDLGQFPHVLAHQERLWARPAWQRVRAEMESAA